MKAKLQVLLWKIESAYDTDPVPTNTANFINAQNVDINPLEMDTDDATPVRNTFGQDEKIVGATWCSVSFDFLLNGGGTPAGDVTKLPNWDPIVRAAGMARTVTAGTSITYSPIDTGEESAAMYYYLDGVLQKMGGIRGSLSFDWTARKAPRVTFKGIGLNKPMVDAALPVPTLPNVPRPMAVNKANTVLSIGVYSARLSQFTIDQGNDVQYRNLTNREDVVLVDRNTSGKVTVELPLLAEKDFLGASGIVTLGTAGAMNVVHGTAAGNIVTVALPSVQLLKPKPKTEAGIMMLECDLHVVRNQMTITCT